MERNPIQIKTPITTDLSQIEVIRQLFTVAASQGYGLAVWRLPNDFMTYAIISENIKRFDRAEPFEDLPFGFLFNPYKVSEPGVYLPADRYFQFSHGKLSTAEDPLQRDHLEWLQEKMAISTPVHRKNPVRSDDQTFSNNNSRSDYTALVTRCMHAIEAGLFEKVVPSRMKTVSLPETFDLSDAITRLSHAYPNALVSYVYTPEHGSWLGATPEILVSIEQKSIFRTVALAGTQPYTPGMNLRQVAWTQKEIEEQALVGRYIINCFKKIRLREYEEHGPKTMVAGNLMHLKSDFRVDMKATNFPQLGSVMLRLLHPTSAVCGMPMEAAYDFLTQEEGHDRSFYSGFLGPVNHQDNTHLYVNLRCMKISGNNASCYAGAGVTIDSIPEKEWEETEYKMNTLLNVIR